MKKEGEGEEVKRNLRMQPSSELFMSSCVFFKPIIGSGSEEAPQKFEIDELNATPAAHSVLNASK